LTKKLSQQHIKRAASEAFEPIHELTERLEATAGNENQEFSNSWAAHVEKLSDYFIITALNRHLDLTKQLENPYHLAKDVDVRDELAVALAAYIASYSLNNSDNHEATLLDKKDFKPEAEQVITKIEEAIESQLTILGLVAAETPSELTPSEPAPNTPDWNALALQDAIGEPNTDIFRSSDVSWGTQAPQNETVGHYDIGEADTNINPKDLKNSFQTQLFTKLAGSILIQHANMTPVQIEIMSQELAKYQYVTVSADKMYEIVDEHTKDMPIALAWSLSNEVLGVFLETKEHFKNQNQSQGRQ